MIYFYISDHRLLESNTPLDEHGDNLHIQECSQSREARSSLPAVDSHSAVRLLG